MTKGEEQRAGCRCGGRGEEASNAPIAESGFGGGAVMAMALDRFVGEMRRSISVEFVVWESMLSEIDRGKVSVFRPYGTAWPARLLGSRP